MSSLHISHFRHCECWCEEVVAHKCVFLCVNLWVNVLQRHACTWSAAVDSGSPQRSNDAINGRHVCQESTAHTITLCLPARTFDTKPPARCNINWDLLSQAKHFPSPLIQFIAQGTFTVAWAAIRRRGELCAFININMSCYFEGLNHKDKRGAY